MRKSVVLGFSLVLLACTAATALVIVSTESLARTVVVAPSVVVHGVERTAVKDGSTAELTEPGDIDGSGDSTVTAAADAEVSESTAIATPTERWRQKSEAELDAEDRYIDRLAGRENHDARGRARAAMASTTDDGGIPLPVGGIAFAAREQYAPVAQMEPYSEPVPEIPDEPEPQFIPDASYGYGYNYYGGFPALPSGNAQPVSPGVQPYQTAPYQAQPPPAAMRGF